MKMWFDKKAGYISSHFCLSQRFSIRSQSAPPKTHFHVLIYGSCIIGPFEVSKVSPKLRETKAHRLLP